MGYTTFFKGSFKFNEKVIPELVKFINNYSQSRHFLFNNDLIKKYDPDWEKHCFNGNLGKNGQHYICPSKLDDSKILTNGNWQDYNESGECPGLYCQWIIKNNTLKWDEGEKFYYYVEWLEYLITNYFEPMGYKLNGIVKYQGENMYDRGYIKVTDNEIEVHRDY